jgi:hypothetical protein
LAAAKCKTDNGQLTIKNRVGLGRRAFGDGLFWRGLADYESSVLAALLLI